VSNKLRWPVHLIAETALAAPFKRIEFDPAFIRTELRISPPFNSNAGREGLAALLAQF